MSFSRRLACAHFWGAFSLCLAFFTIAVSSVRADEPNQTFAESTILEPGILSITDNLTPGVGNAPNTFLGAFDEGGFDPFFNFITDDDNSSTLGDDNASGLSDIGVNADGSINLIVTGNGDFFFEGDHSEVGGYRGFVEVFDSAQQLIDEFTFDGSLQAGEFDQHSFSNNTWLGGSFDINLDNTVEGFTDGDVDYFTFTGLAPGATFAAETSSAGAIDTLLGWFDDAGSLIAQDDDGGVGVFSLLEGTVPASGELTFAVSGGGDDSFVGAHAEQEVYELRISLDGESLPGDFDGDGDVDQFDLTNPALGWLVRFGLDLDGGDFLLWQQEFGTGTAAASAVPEPLNSTLALLSVALWMSNRKRKCFKVTH